MSSRIATAAKSFARASARQIRNWAAERQMRRVDALLNRSEPPQSCDETVFAKLQAQYPSRDVYHYDSASVWQRGVERAMHLVKIGGVHKTSLVAEIGCGDGMVSAALDLCGCRTLLFDVEDWRDERARHLELQLSDPCIRLPTADSRFDLVFSYNTFEHLSDPAGAFVESLRICKPGGLVYLAFDPLYCSPWGLHAYRTIHMPYAQFLFSTDFLNRKIDELGIIDLGVHRKALQPLNKWRLKEFLGLWQRPDCTVESQETTTDMTYLDIIQKYPRAFSGKGLTPSDVTTTGITVLLRKC